MFRLRQQFSPRFLLHMHIHSCIDTNIVCPSPTVNSNALLHYWLVPLTPLLTCSTCLCQRSGVLGLWQMAKSSQSVMVCPAPCVLYLPFLRKKRITCSMQTFMCDHKKLLEKMVKKPHRPLAPCSITRSSTLFNHLVHLAGLGDGMKM